MVVPELFSSYLNESLIRQLRCWTPSPIDHLHVNDFLYARLSHRYIWTPWIIVPSSRIRVFSAPFALLCCIPIFCFGIVDIGRVRFDGR